MASRSLMQSRASEWPHHAAELARQPITLIGLYGGRRDRGAIGRPVTLIDCLHPAMVSLAATAAICTGLPDL